MERAGTAYAYQTHQIGFWAIGEKIFRFAVTGIAHFHTQLVMERQARVIQKNVHLDGSRQFLILCTADTFTTQWNDPRTALLPLWLWQ